MGLFSRTNSRSSSRAISRENSVHRNPGLTPIPIESRDDGRGHSSRSTTRFFDIGVSGDWNYPNRRTMEDASVAIADYLDVPGCGFFAVFDGHAGAQCAQIAAEHVHVILARILHEQGPHKDVALALSETFLAMDDQLRNMEVKNSGATAVVAVCCYMSPANEIVAPSQPGAARRLFVANVGDSRAVLGARITQTDTNDQKDTHTGNKESLTGVRKPQNDTHSRQHSRQHSPSDSLNNNSDSVDTRRLTYDHRCTDPHEQRRVTNAGGLVVNNRVNGMLAVTRSLGDLFMKNYVVGAPYTTESEIEASDFLVIACDGLFDVCKDETAVEIVSTAFREEQKASDASDKLLAQALQSFSMDNVTVMVVKFTK